MELLDSIKAAEAEAERRKQAAREEAEQLYARTLEEARGEASEQIAQATREAEECRRQAANEAKDEWDRLVAESAVRDRKAVEAARANLNRAAEAIIRAL